MSIETLDERQNGHKQGEAAKKPKVNMAQEGTAPEMIDLYNVPKLAKIGVPIEGLSSFISHRKDEKAGELWEKKTTGKGMRKELCNPEAEWKASLYLHPETNRPCIPGRGIKKAMVSTHIFGNDKGLKRRLQGAFFVTEELIPIEYEKEVKRRDFLPLKGGMSHHNSYRVEFFGWKAKIPIEYDSALIPPEALVNMLERAGFSIGVGDDRPEKNGMHGRWRVVAQGRK